MKTRLLLLAFFTLFTTIVYGQIQSAQGKLLLTDGQELRGAITHFYDHPTEIILQTTDNARRTLLPEEVAEIQLADSRRFVVRNLNSERLVFQLLIASEKLSLLKRETPSPVFYIAKDEQVHLLENNETTLQVDGKRYKKEDFRYIGILTTLMQDRPDLTEKIQKTELKESSLVTLVLAYTDGNVNYYHPSDAKLERDPYWAAYAQYSNIHAADITTGRSFSYQVGAQYYFSSASRSSLRLGLDYITYRFKDANSKVYQLIAGYQYDFIKTSKMNAYLMAAFFGIGYAETDYLDEREKESSFGAGIRIIPGAGFEYRSTEKLSFYGELNQLFRLKSLPQNYSFGIKYAFRK